jgi:uncharacterized protein VirK/YbjX
MKTLALNFFVYQLVPSEPTKPTIYMTNKLIVASACQDRLSYCKKGPNGLGITALMIDRLVALRGKVLRLKPKTFQLDCDSIGATDAASLITVQTKRKTFQQLNLVASEIYSGFSPRSIAYRWSARLLVLFRINRVHKWLRRNKDNAILLDELHYSPRMYAAVLRPYVNQRWPVAKRLGALEEHYLTIAEKGRLLVFNENQYLDLIQLGAEYLDLRVVLDKPRWMRGEGEIAVSLFCQNNRIYTAMFLVTGSLEDRKLVVGAIQGWGGAQAKELYVELTRALHGMRPRDFLISTLKMIATNLGCAEILGVSDACHRSTQRFSGAVKESAYDAIWQDQGGQLNAEGFFVLSTEVKQREATEIPARKRAQYRRRYELIDNIQQKINHSFATNERVIMNHQHVDQSVEI